MNGLALSLDDIDFATLVERARATIPAIAPVWTDFNLHDPGITLLELMAFAADVQIYGLGRLRQDERRGYAAMLGIRPHGPRPAQGLLWPNENSVAAGRWLAPGTGATASGDAPDCSLVLGVWFTPARLVRIATRLADGTETDQTAANGRPGASFAPFGSAPMLRTQLRLDFDGPLVQGCDLSAGEAPVLSIGVQVEPFGDSGGSSPVSGPPSAAVTGAVAGVQGFDQPIQILADDTGGFARSGAMLLRLPDALTQPGAPDKIRIVLVLASGAFSIPPRVLRIGVNALAIRQIHAAWIEQAATGLPDQVLTLTGEMPADGAAATVRVLTSAGPQTWSAVDDLELAGPADRVFVFNGTDSFRFGNGVNGALPPFGASIRVDYAATAGQAGNVPPQADWSVGGVAARFTNFDPLAGGLAGDTLDGLRHAARMLLADAHPLVTDIDLANAALEAPGLHVARAEIIENYDPVQPCLAAKLGTRTLVALRRRRHSEAGAEPIAEDTGWLAALERHLRPALPLGERLRVVGPDYVPVAVRASLVLRQGIDAAAIVAAAAELLRGRLAPLPIGAFEPWKLGRSVVLLTLAGWLRRIEGVVAIKSLSLNGQTSGVVALRAHQLPWFTFGAGDIVTTYAGAGP